MLVIHQTQHGYQHVTGFLDTEQELKLFKEATHYQQGVVTERGNGLVATAVPEIGDYVSWMTEAPV
jgi:hypothetical protein